MNDERNNLVFLLNDAIVKLGCLYTYDEAKSIAEQVFMFALRVRRIDLYLSKDTLLSPDQKNKIDGLMEQLVEGMPLQYVLGTVHFYGTDLLVTPDVLIPRPETEELIDIIVKNQPGTRGKILDIGTGSGCIAIALKRSFSDADVYAVDISSSALALAARNAKESHTPICFVEDSILNPSKIIQNAPFDIIVSNPPYVTRSEKEKMHINVLNFEPHLALFVDDTDPLVFYKAIIDFAVDNLNSKGFVYLEINERFPEEVCSLFRDNYFYDIEPAKDINGRWRFVKAVKR